MIRLYKFFIFFILVLTFKGVLAIVVELQPQKLTSNTLTSKEPWKFFKVNTQLFEVDSTIHVTLEHKSEGASLTLYTKIGMQPNEKNFDHKSSCSGNTVSASVSFLRPPLDTDVVYIGVFLQQKKPVDFTISFEVIEPIGSSSIVFITVAIVVGAVSVGIFFIGTKKSNKLTHSETKPNTKVVNSTPTHTASVINSIPSEPKPSTDMPTGTNQHKPEPNSPVTATSKIEVPSSSIKEVRNNVSGSTLQQKIAAFNVAVQATKEPTPKQDVKAHLNDEITKKQEETEKVVKLEQNARDEFKKQEEERKKRQLEEARKFAEAAALKKKQEEEKKKQLPINEENKKEESTIKTNENTEQTEVDSAVSEFQKNKRKLSISLSTPTVNTNGSQPTSEAIANFQAQSKTLPKFGKSEQCEVCNQTVYLMEKLVIEGKIYHKKCFQCEVCKKPLSAGKFAALSGKNYCKPHFKQLFALKGNYSEAFGEEKPQAQWAASHSVTSAANTEETNSVIDN